MEDFDFGFTTVTEEELEVVQNAGKTEEKIDKLYKAIQPLLENLKANPDKDYIYWPNRVAKINEFQNMIKRIVE